MTAQADEQRHAAAREQLRIERIRRRKQRRRQRTQGVFGGVFQSLFVVGLTATLAATLFTWLASPDFIAPDVRDNLSVAMATATNQGALLVATDLPTTPNWLRRIGIVSGHRGPENDPGAVCPDGLTEAEINLNVATRVVRNLQARGYTVDLLDEFDPRLSGYQAEVLLSLHANTCQDYGEVVSGYLISTADLRAGSGNDQLLVECVAAHYQQASQLARRYGLTRDMTDYHIFREIDPLTPAAILEMGFMFGDRDILTGDPDILARGITNGILCYLEPGDANVLATLQAPTPNPIIPTLAPTLTPENLQ
jgi:N-acetylmuramoyl-L-alanine amidase